MSTLPNLYYVYADADAGYLVELERQLSHLEGQGLLRSWHRRSLLPGEDWQKASELHFEDADIILLLVSPDFLDSKYCYDTEVERAMLRHRKGNAIVVPVLLRPCMWEMAPFAACRALPENGTPVSLWDDADSAFLDVATGIHGLLVSAERRHLARTEHTPASTARFAVRECVDRLEGLLAALSRNADDLEKANKLRTEIGALDNFVRPLLNPKAGDVIAGTELLHPIGSGAFATVWLSKSPGLDSGQRFATKILHATCLTTGSMLFRFRHGMKAMKYLTRKKDVHPQIVPLLKEDDSSLAFAMPFLPGHNLVNVKERGWCTEKKVEIILSICRAVEYAHKKGVVHRDIKPANIVFDESGLPILTDFDIADMGHMTTVATDERGLGSPMFAAPEQLEDGEKPDGRFDVYSLGRLLHYLLIEGPMRVTPEDSTDLSKLSRFPASLVYIVRKATRGSAANRYPDVATFRAALEHYQSLWSGVSASFGAFGRRLGRGLALGGMVLSTMAAAERFRQYHEHREQQYGALSAQYDLLRRDYEDLARDKGSFADRKRELERRMEAIVTRFNQHEEETNLTPAERSLLNVKLLQQWRPLRAEYDNLLEKDAELTRNIHEQLAVIEEARKQLESEREARGLGPVAAWQPAAALAGQSSPPPDPPADQPRADQPLVKSQVLPALNFTELWPAVVSAEAHAIARCKAPAGAETNVTVSLTVHPSGRVSARMIAGPRETTAEICVLGAFTAVRVQAFEGSTFATTKKLVLRNER